MTALEHVNLSDLSAALEQRELDGWLVYDFHGVNPLAARLLDPHGMVTRRLFLWLPAVGRPTLVVHGVDHQALAVFPGDVTVYTTWQELHERLEALVKGRRIAMEVSPENAVPYLDRVPSGVVELLSRLGATVVPSDPLVTAFAARWSPEELEDHRRAAELIADIARQTLGRVVGEPGSANELDVQRSVREALDRAGLITEDPPIVAFGIHAANPHYGPSAATNLTLEENQVVLLDLWARRSPRTVWADQTWMAFSGKVVPDRVTEVWQTVKAARNAAVTRLGEALAAGSTVTGADLDRASRGVIEDRGFGDAFFHRTGHSIELDLHGSGPHLDDFETHDVRELMPGIAFSVEPGVYLKGEFGVRSEINVVVGEVSPEVTPHEPQQDLIIPG